MWCAWAECADSSLCCFVSYTFDISCYNTFILYSFIPQQLPLLDVAHPAPPLQGEAVVAAVVAGTCCTCFLCCTIAKKYCGDSICAPHD